MEWFRNWFDERYLTVYRHRDGAEAERFVKRWPVWDGIPAGGWCLDLGCGAGRYARAIAARGLKVLGLDLSRLLIRTSQDEADGGCSVRFVRADMRAIPSAGPFVLVVSLFTSFGYFDDDDQHRRLLRDLHHILAPEGRIVMDLPNPIAVRLKVSQEPASHASVGGLVIHEERHLEESPLRVVKRIVIREGDQRFEYQESVRLYTSGELEAMMIEAGFSPQAAEPLQTAEPLHASETHQAVVWGDYDGSPFSPSSPRIVYFGSKSG